MNDTDKLQPWFRRNFGGLWLSASFRRLWLSLTVTSFGAQITNLALPLTAALLLNATPMQMGVLVALETLPFALFSLHAGVLLDRVRKLPVIIAADVGRGIALLAIPITAWFGVLSMEILFAVGFLCGMQNVVGGAAYQVLLAQMAGRKRLVEANAKVTLGETSAALIGPGIAGGLIHVLTAPFAIALDAMTFFASAMMLRRIKAPNDVARDGANGGVWREIGEGLKLVWGNRTLWGLAWLAGIWQFLHHMQVAVLILFATRELGLSAGAIGLAYVFGGAGCVLASASAERLSARFGIGPVIVHGLILSAFGWQAYGLIGGPPWLAGLLLGVAMLVFDFGAILYAINYLSLRQAITPDRLLGRMTATMRFVTVASAPIGSLVGGALASQIGLRSTLLAVGMLGLLLSAAAVLWSPVRRHRTLPDPLID
ncbi:MAG TPA: MFS transporter [Casimicrobiaceae bacterium]|jgi:MFS family permease|nr:MFS transporter [Casimicrobiaceae bacterium]